jgi:hypothetical protein
MRSACREYLDAVGAVHEGSEPPAEFDLALAQLRQMFRAAALHVHALYKLPTAAQLVDEMDQADRNARGEDPINTRRQPGTRNPPTLVFAPPGVKRMAFAEEPETTVLAFGGTPGKAYEPDGWELWAR